MSSELAQHPGAQWKTLTAIATMGVDRVGPEAVLAGDENAALFGLSSEASPAELLLDRVAALSVYASAGRSPEPIDIEFA